MTIAGLVGLMLVIAFIGLVAYLIVRLVPMPPNVAMLIYVLAGIVCLLWVLQAFGLVSGISPVRLH